VREYTRGQLTLLSDASRILHDTSLGEETPEEPKAGKPVRKRDAAIERYIQTADTRKMTLTEYKRFLSLQQEPGD